ncbi:uncharacterized protein L3040_005362 [Drepanopeziza brunnea f. sp. 'multigermtubi']|uniref:2EXR domain-containing protein n=1 Tax=Marssonina brunnea f. sp. multigermtubi (strain MB_m1) TaxID=1072389 RepID=K1WVY6_MARBU|nr:uncharacterized protein MBM_04718 [Drepanopeziza brunnea f. sp. 'multigermtubi' MB_m1]EKD17141.1 hypothetical protein MBM_04718 [Drepanopeziza brunnea f. sp. 'multigermtubi' MB_m1]KAJ5041795.1 hypothetical protein L3040_005362 [Drepanopeziza brunnea f. sp. 'multigermtubi']
MSNITQAPVIIDATVRKDIAAVHASVSELSAEPAATITEVSRPAAPFVPLTEFHLFPKLPKHVRVQILMTNQPDREYVDIYYARTRRGEHGLESVYYTTCTAPAIMHLNREHRLLGLTIYSLELDTIFINWKKEKICLMTQHHNIPAIDVLPARAVAKGSKSICIGIATTIKNPSGCDPIEDANPMNEGSDDEMCWGHGIQQIDSVMDSFPFAEGLKEVTLFAHGYYNRINRLKSLRSRGLALDTDIFMSPFEHDVVDQADPTLTYITIEEQIKSFVVNKGWEVEEDPLGVHALQEEGLVVKKFVDEDGQRTLKGAITLKLRDIWFRGEKSDDWPLASPSHSEGGYC